MGSVRPLYISNAGAVYLGGSLARSISSEKGDEEIWSSAFQTAPCSPQLPLIFGILGGKASLPRCWLGPLLGGLEWIEPKSFLVGDGISAFDSECAFENASEFSWLFFSHPLLSLSFAGILSLTCLFRLLICRWRSAMILWLSWVGDLDEDEAFGLFLTNLWLSTLWLGLVCV